MIKMLYAFHCILCQCKLHWLHDAAIVESEQVLKGITKRIDKNVTC